MLDCDGNSDEAFNSLISHKFYEKFFLCNQGRCGRCKVCSNPSCSESCMIANDQPGDPIGRRLKFPFANRVVAGGAMEAVYGSR